MNGRRAKQIRRLGLTPKPGPAFAEPRSQVERLGGSVAGRRMTPASFITHTVRYCSPCCRGHREQRAEPLSLAPRPHRMLVDEVA